MLYIQLLGSPRIFHHRQKSSCRITRCEVRLLSYLLLHGKRPHSRERLLGLMWGEQEERRARACLSTALWRLKRILSPGTAKSDGFIKRTGNEIVFNWDRPHWVDVFLFEERIKAALSVEEDARPVIQTRSLEEALGLYTGDLMEGFYDDWILLERERLLDLYIQGLTRLVFNYMHSGQITKALACGRKILHHDPLREDVHRTMMRLYVKAGQPGQALRQFKFCTDIFKKELGLLPGEETRECLRWILKNRNLLKSSGMSDMYTEVDPDRSALSLLEAIEALEDCQARLCQVISSLKAALGAGICPKGPLPPVGRPQKIKAVKQS